MTINEYYATKKFDNNQMREIFLGCKCLPEEYVAVYAKSEFNAKQMREIRYGFEDGCSSDFVSIYANTKFTWRQMQQIRQGIDKGLTQEQILFYAKSEFDEQQMFNIARYISTHNSDNTFALLKSFNSETMFCIIKMNYKEDDLKKLYPYKEFKLSENELEYIIKNNSSDNVIDLGELKI